MARRLLLLPLTDCVGVAHNDLVHPGERLGEKNGALEEAQMTTVQRQGEDYILFLFCREGGGERKKERGGSREKRVKKQQKRD